MEDIQDSDIRRMARFIWKTVCFKFAFDGCKVTVSKTILSDRYTACHVSAFSASGGNRIINFSYGH